MAIVAWRGAPAPVEVSAEDQVLLGIEHGHLGPALADLPPELRGAIEATVLDGLTCAEAAALLRVAEGTVKSRCHPGPSGSLERLPPSTPSGAVRRLERAHDRRRGVL